MFIFHSYSTSCFSIFLILYLWFCVTLTVKMICLLILEDRDASQCSAVMFEQACIWSAKPRFVLRWRMATKMTCLGCILCHLQTLKKTPLCYMWWNQNWQPENQSQPSSKNLNDNPAVCKQAGLLSHTLKTSQCSPGGTRTCIVISSKWFTVKYSSLVGHRGH